MFREVLEGQIALFGLMHKNTLHTRTLLASHLHDHGENEEADGHYHAAVAGFVTTLGETHEQTLSSKGSLANLLMNTGRVQEAEEMYRKVLNGYMVLYGSEHKCTYETQFNLACLLDRKQSDEDSMAEAEELLRSVVVGYEKAFGKAVFPGALGAPTRKVASHRGASGCELPRSGSHSNQPPRTPAPLPLPSLSLSLSARLGSTQERSGR